MRLNRLPMHCVLLLVLVLSGCVLGVREPIVLTSRSETVTLEWDKPSLDVARSMVEVASYLVYYKVGGGTVWTQLGEAPASEHPWYTIRFEDMPGEGTYAFAVRAVFTGGQQSTLHTSMDLGASPPTGWYLLWMRPG